MRATRMFQMTVLVQKSKKKKEERLNVSCQVGAVFSPPHVLVDTGSGCWNAGCRSSRSVAALELLTGKWRTQRKSWCDITSSNYVFLGLRLSIFCCDYFDYMMLSLITIQLCYHHNMPTMSTRVTLYTAGQFTLHHCGTETQQKILLTFLFLWNTIFAVEHIKQLFYLLAY